MPDNLTTVDVNVNLKYPCTQHKDVENYAKAEAVYGLVSVKRYTKGEQGLKFNSHRRCRNMQQLTAINDTHNKNEGDRRGTGIDGV